MLRTLGPEHYGGRGDLGAKIEAEAVRRGITPLEVGDSVSLSCRVMSWTRVLRIQSKLYAHTDGSIIKVAGVPDMYDWEYFPQLVRL